MSSWKSSVNSENFDAVLFNLDGVLTATFKVHAACWKKTFDDYLQQRAVQTLKPFKPFDINKDYNLYVDGKPRDDGVQSFLGSRGIHLPLGDPRDPPDRKTVCGLGNHKEELVIATLKSEGVEVYQGSVAWVKQLRQEGIKTAVVSSNKNCLTVLQAEGIEGLFDVRVDGHTVEDQNLPGKPPPYTYFHAAAQVEALRRRAPERFQALAERTGLHPQEIQDWQRAAREMHIPFSVILSIGENLKFADS
jgi:beta-phosphoglucomutase-like phosphatase (HAD superfamily)